MKQGKKKPTRLDAFLFGVGALADLGATAYRPPKHRRLKLKSDAEALAADWRQVGADLLAASRMVEPE
jgi:hypothetical protein